MNCVPDGRWGIESIIIDDQTVLNYEGFEFLCVDGEDVSIQPVGIRFVVDEATESSAIYKSRDTNYFVKSNVSGQSLQLQMTRPNYKETFSITAKLVTTGKTMSHPVV